jgi:hypothetical protein
VRIRFLIINLLFLTVLLRFPAALSQNTVQGRIRDAKTGKSLPQANIQVENTFQGTITNEQGEFRLIIRELPATLLVRYIGYHSQRVPVGREVPPMLDIRLEPTVIPLQTVTVTGEDPATGIMRRVIEKKKLWRERLASYQADAYTRLILENDTGIVSISESTSRIFWEKDEGNREVIQAKTETSNIRSNDLFALASFMPNLYDDDIDIMGFRMVGPTHPRALSYYRFKLTGERRLDDMAVFDISVTPRNKLQPTFVGRISVLDEEFAMIDLDLKPNESMLFPQPIQEFDLHFLQQFSDFSQEVWLPVDVRVEGGIRVGLPGLSIPTIRYRQVSRLSDYQINVAVPDSLFEGDDDYIVDSMAVRLDTLFSARTRVIPLTPREKAAYAGLDSTMTLDKAFQPTGFLARMARVRIGSDEDTEGGERRSRWSLIDHLRPQLRFNRVDGGHLGMDITTDILKRVRISGGAAYKTALKRWSYNANLRINWGKRRRGLFNVSFRRDTDTRFPREIYPLLINSVNTLLGFQDYYDYYWNESLRAEIGYRFPVLRTRLTLGWRQEDHKSVAKNTDWNLFGRDYIQRANPDVLEGRLRSLTLSLSMGEEAAPWGTIGTSGFRLDVEHSDPDLMESAFRFTRLRGALSLHLNTFLRRRLMPNALDIQIVAGTSTGNSPPQRTGAMDVRLGILSPFGVFRSLRGYPVEGDRYAGLYWEHNFRTVPFEILGLHGLARYGLGILIHGAHGRTWISEGSSLASMPGLHHLDEIHHELGLSLNGVLGFFRLDAVMNLKTRKVFFGVGLVRYY